MMGFVDWCALLGLFCCLLLLLWRGRDGRVLILVGMVLVDGVVSDGCVCRLIVLVVLVFCVGGVNSRFDRVGSIMHLLWLVLLCGATCTKNLKGQ